MVNTLVKKSLNALTAKQTNIFSAAFFIIITTVLSQILGVVKYRLLVHYFNPQHAGIFLASFRIPDFLSILFIAGGISSSFIPVFSEYLKKDNPKEGYAFASSLLYMVAGVFAVISVIVVVFSYQLSAFVAQGFSPQELRIMSDLVKIIQLAQLFFIIGMIMTAILQSYQHFLIPGIATSLYNIGIIIGMIVFAPVFGIYGATIGVLIGSILFCLVQVPLLLKTGFKFVYKPTFHTGLKKFVTFMSPTILSVIIIQISATANLRIASYLSPGAYLVFDFAQTLVAAPVLLFGQSIAQASFPALSLKSQDNKEFLSIFTTSFNQIVYLIFPISAILIVLRIPTVRLLYGAQKFDWTATVDTGLTVSYFAISLFAQALIYLLARAFYAIKDTTTPFVITIFSVIINISLAYIFILVYHFPIYFLALAYSIANIFTFILMFLFLDRKIHIPKLEISISIIKISIATFVMGAALYIPIHLLEGLVFNTKRTVELIMLTGIASFLGFVSYVFFTWLLDIREALYIIHMLQNLRHRNTILKQVQELIDTPRSGS